MDELAQSVKMDPLEFRLKNAKDERLRAVIVAAADKFGWKARRKTAGAGLRHGGGLREGRLRGDLRGGQRGSPRPAAVKVLRAVVAFECGAVVNPEHLRNQVEGAIVMGLGRRAVRGDSVRRRARFSRTGWRSTGCRGSADMPVIESVLLDRKDLVSAGAGETPIVGIAPAIGNAIFDASGKRIRRLPLMA